MSSEEIQSNIKLIKDEIREIKTKEKKVVQDEIDKIKESLQAENLDNKKREGLEAQVVSLQARLAPLDAQLAEKEKRLAAYEQRKWEWESTNKPLQTDRFQSNQSYIQGKVSSNSSLSYQSSLRSTDSTGDSRSGVGISSPIISRVQISKTDTSHKISVGSEYAICSIDANDFNEFVQYFKLESDLRIEKNIPKYEWPLKKGEKVNEIAATNGILTHFETHLLPDGFCCNRDDKNICVEVPVRLTTFLGKVDAIVYNKKHSEMLRDLMTYIAIEIKRFLEGSNVVQSFIEFVGMIIRSNLPVLHIQTDMETFVFMICMNNPNTFYRYKTKDYSECKAIISNWIKYADSIDRFSYDNHIKARNRLIMDSRLLLTQTIQFVPIEEPKKLPTFSFEHTSHLIFCDIKFLNALENAYISAEISEKLERISIENNRSGPVYKLEHDGKTLAIKLCCSFAIDHKGKRIINELFNEKHIYSKLSNCPEGPWPKLYYAGYMFNQNYYAIVTEFIDGRKPKKKSEVDFQLCKVALTMLHDKKIAHKDPRRPNFIIISDKQAIIIDFGFSTIDPDNFTNDFALMKKSFEMK